MPRFIIFVRATSESESELGPDRELLQAMSDYNATLYEAGILQLADGLHCSSRDSSRIIFHDSGSPTVQSGPFPANELVSGFWIVKVKDLDEAVAWAVKCPFKEGAVTEVRRIAAMEDFGDLMGPEISKREGKLREELEKIAKSG
ncbi:dgpfaetke family protein [Acephala macrosclerotiorum]|nr:dgpfaetke family protein [Acephala macrosclerotiorum]